jgi:hypothetical protein
LHTQLQSPVGLAKKHMSARACHKASRLIYSATDQDAMSASVFRVRRNSWRRTQILSGQGQKETTADNKGVRSVKSCKHTNPASKVHVSKRDRREYAEVCMVFLSMLVVTDRLIKCLL